MRLKKFFKVTAITLMIFLTLLLVLGLKTNINEKYLSDNIIKVVNGKLYSKPLELKGFKIYGQKYKNTCGPNTISMTCTYLGDVKTEQDVLNELGLQNKKGNMLPNAFLKYSGISLKGYSIVLKNNIKDSKVLDIIYSQLSKNLPVPFFFSTINEWNKPNYDTHYSLIIGVNFMKNQITIANSYGFKEVMDIKYFLNSLKYENFKNMPIPFKLAKNLGYIKMNNIYVINAKGAVNN